MFGFKMPVKVSGLEAKAEAVANVLNEHKVFGEVDGRWLESEIRGFKHMVVAHAKGEGYSSGYLELTYPSCVRLIINTTVFAGEADFSEVTAYDHPWKNARMDYEALNADITAALNEFAAW